MTTITIKPSNNVYKELENTQMTYLQAIGELIDNSIGSMTETNKCNVLIEISGDWTDHILDINSATLSITDDSKGIAEQDIGDALSPAANSNKHQYSLHEHGMGLKAALVSLGSKYNYDKNGNIKSISGFSITTKTKDMKQPLIINKLHFGDIQCTNSSYSFEKNCGTKIEIKHLKNIPTKKEYFTGLRYFLGHRYQRFLRGIHNKKLNLELRLTSTDGKIMTDSKGQECKYTIYAIEPSYNLGKPLISTKLENGERSGGKQWSAQLQFGWSPTDLEFENYPLGDPIKEQLKNKHPYYYLNRKIDIVMNDIVIAQNNYSWLTGNTEETNGRDFRNNNPRMVIEIEKGFSSTFTKNGIQESQHLEELKEKINKAIKQYKNSDKAWRDEMGAKDKMEKMIRNIDPNYTREQTDKYGLKTDFIINKENKKEIWEVKVIEASPADVIQLLGYMSTNCIDNGRLIAPKFSDNTENLVKDLGNYPEWKNKNIELTLLNDMM